MAKERDAHTTIYVGLLKKNGSVVEGRKAQAVNQPKGPDPNGSGKVATATRQAAADLDKV